MKRFIIHWKEGKAKHSLITPHVAHRGQALKYLLDMKPYLLWKLKDVKIKVWNRSMEQ